MLAGSDDALAYIVGLQAAHEGGTHGRDQVGILAEGLLDAPPAWIASHVQHRCQRLVRPHRLHLGTYDAAHSRDELRLPGTGDAYDLREARGPAGHIAATG